MRKILYILLTVVCVWVFTNNTYAQIRVINNKGTFFQVDTSKWVLSGIDIYNKNTVGNVGIGTFPNNARFVVSNGGSAVLPAFKLKYPFSGSISDSILTWNPSDSTVRKIAMSSFAWGLLGNSAINVPTSPLTYGSSTFSVNENWLGTTDNEPLTFGTNSIERMRILPDGSIGIGTAVTGNNSFLTINTSNSTFLNGIYMNMSNNTGTAHGLNVETTLPNVNGLRYNNTSTSNTSFYGVGSILSGGNIVSSYLSYRNGTGLSYGVYGINGTTSTYATAANTWAAFLQGRVVISSETSPTSGLGTDLEIRNTTTGAGNPAVLSLRQTTNNTTSGNVLGQINFGDNYVLTPQAQIRVFRDAASSGATDLPTAITFYTIGDGTTVLNERMRITSAGNVGIGVTPTTRFHVNGTIRFQSMGTNLVNTLVLTSDVNGVVTTRTLASLLSGSAITSLNGLTASIQTFAIGTTGTNFNIVSSGSAHTFNFPNASSTNRGLLTNTDWITFNDKIGTVTATTPAAVTTVGTTATINNTSAYWNANQLQSRNVASTAPSDGQILTWNNTSSFWEPSTYVTNAWNLTGNTGTNPATNFLGTTDSQRLVFRTNNTEKMTILSDGSVGIGTASPTNILHIDAINPLRLVGIQTNTTDTNLLVTTSTGVIQQRGILNLLSGKAILSLNGLTNSIQTFAIGTTGTDFNIVSSGSIHTFHFPNASSANRGLLTAADWSTFNNKIGIVTASTPAAVTTVGPIATINNTGAYWNANQLQTRNVASTAPINGQVLTWNNTSSLWEPSTYVTNAWNLTGNTGTNPSTNFLGTTDSQRLVFRTNNIERMTILSNGYVGIGEATPTNLFHLNGTNPLRLEGLQTNTTDTNLLVTTSTGVIQQRGILNMLSGKAILSLNGLTNSIQTFATGTTGTDFNILSSGSSHTFNFPNASTTNRGLLTAADWSTFNNKIGIVTASTPAAVTTVGPIATINNTGAYWNANQLQTRNVASTAPTNGQVLTWNTTSSLWEPSTYVTNAWNLTGNTGTNPATNFLGTTDSQRLVFRTNNTEKMTILSDGSVGIGTAVPSNRLHIDATNPLRLVGLQNNTTDTNLLVTTSTGVIQQRGILNMLSGKAILSLNGLTNSIQTFATGTTGTDFNILSSGSTHTFNFPNASTTNRGLLTNTDWNTFNNKIGTVNATTPAAVTTSGTTATINNTGAYWNANQLQGRNISTTAPTNGQVLLWNNTTSVWEPSSNISNDAKDHHITRTNTTPNVAPLLSEIALPINGYTAKVRLTNGRVEYWNYNGTAWTLDWTQIPPVDGIDIGYIVGWGSNITPPDYLLPLNGGTYNWSDFPHFQSLHATHPSEFVASSNATTFTLVNINTSGRFLRGGLTAGINQNFTTALPVIPFGLSNYTHNHNYTNTTYIFTDQRVYNGVDGLLPTYSSLSNNNLTSSNDTHSHTLTSGGDSETRPINTSVIWCLKVKPTMTAGNITINTGSVTISSVSNSIVDNELTTTVNGVSSTPVTLPTPEPAVVEIYDAAGTQALSTTFANLTFGTTNIADAGYTVGGSGSQITVTTAGTYRITYRVSARCTTNQGNGSEYQLTRNGVYVPGSIGYAKHHNSDRPHGTVTVVKLLTLSANDIIRVQGRQYSANGSISLSQDGSSLIIERIK